MTKRSFPLFFLLSLFIGLLGFHRQALAVNPDDLLPPEKAFPSSVVRTATTLEVSFPVASGYYLYRDRMQFHTEPAGLIQPPRFPEGKTKQDAFFGKQVIYEHPFNVVLQLAPSAPPRFTLVITVQGCSTSGVCYPPYTRRLLIDKQGSADSSGNSWLSDLNSPTPGNGQAIKSPAWPTNTLSVIVTFFVAGLGMAFTACMYPLLPILSSIIAGQGQQLTRGKGFILSLSYVQGLAVCYTVVGVLAGVTGSLLTVWLQQPAVILLSSLLMVALALSMFDLYSIQLPSWLQTHFSERSNRLSGGKVMTVMLMGVFSSLVIGPCVAPPLALALGYIGTTGNAVLGGLALYMMALGLGTPLILIGTFGGHFLPRAGHWMKAIKSLFGVIMLGVAIWLASPFLPAAAPMMLWAALLIGCAVYLNTFDALPKPAHYQYKLGKALGLLLFLVGVAQLIGALAGETNPRYPLHWLKPATTTVADQGQVPPFGPINSLAELNQAVAQAQQQGKPLLLDFYADWCVSCKEMEAETFPAPEVRSRLQQFVLLRADVTANTPAQQILLKHFGLYGPPGIIIFDKKGKEHDRVIGFTSAEVFVKHLQDVL